MLDRDDGGVGKGGVNCSQPASVEFVQAASDSMAALAPSDLCGRQVSRDDREALVRMGWGHRMHRSVSRTKRQNPRLAEGLPHLGFCGALAARTLSLAARTLCTPPGTRTQNLRIKSPMLYQLS